MLIKKLRKNENDNAIEKNCPNANDNETHKKGSIQVCPAQSPIFSELVR